MLTVNIPKQVMPLFARLGTMPENEFDALESALGSATPNLRTEKFVEHVKNLVSGMGSETLELVDIITNLSRSSKDATVTIEELAKSVTALVDVPANENFNPQVLEQRIIRLLSIKPLKLYARASNVQHQYEDLFFVARIISDIRTVFEPDGTKPLGAMIVHNLKITHGQTGQDRHDKFFALDNADLDILLLAIERAKEKTKSLEIIIDEAKLMYFPSK